MYAENIKSELKYFMLYNGHNLCIVDALSTGQRERIKDRQTNKNRDESQTHGHLSVHVNPIH